MTCGQNAEILPLNLAIHIKKKKGKVIPLQARVAQRVGRGIALLFHDRGTRRGWVVSSTPWPHFTPGKDPVPILQEAGWAPGRVWTAGKSRPHRDSIPDRPARRKSLYRLSYLAYCSSIRYYYLAGCTTFPHLPAPIWQLYYILPPVVSVIPVFFH